MNSALKPALGGAGVPTSGQGSPAKANVAGAGLGVGLPQGAAALHHNNLAVQNLTQHVPAPPPPPLPHAAPSMAPVSANMAQMAQNMSHHGNLSHLNQNSAAPPIQVVSPAKSATTSSPLSLVQDKVNASQPLALTRTLEKKELESSGHANGTIDSPKSGANAPTLLKPLNPEPNKEKQDIAKTSPSTPKPPEKPSSAPSTPQKPEGPTPASQADGPAQHKVATVNEPPEKSPLKPAEPKPAPTADIAPSQSDSKLVVESANNSQSTSQPEKPPAVLKQDQDPLATESAKTEIVKPETAKSENVPKVEEKKEEPAEKPQSNTEEAQKKEDVKDKLESSKEDQVDKAPKPEAPVKALPEEKKEVKEVKKPEIKPKSTLKLATVTPPMKKRRQASLSKGDGPTPAKKLAEGETTPTTDARTKRNRTKVQLYQSPTPELTMATKLSASVGRSTPTKPNDDKLIVFYKNEYLAVRNAEGGFYVCQAMQNVYRTTRRIKIRWLSQDKAADASGETYKPDFYDVTDMECVLTTLSLARAAGGAQLLRPAERARAASILQRALKAEAAGGDGPELTLEHPDGLDLSLYTDESQLDKKSRKRNSSKSSPRAKSDANETAKESSSPAKKARTTPKRSPKSGQKAKPTPAKPQTNNNKRKAPAGSTPVVAAASKTATAVTEKAKAGKSTPKRTPAPAKQAKVETPVATPTRGRRAAKDSKPSPIVATPSTSTGKMTRTPRKPPARK